MTQMLYDEAHLDALRHALRAALPMWGLPSAAPIQLLAISENATFRVGLPAGARDVVFRVHRPGYHQRAEIESELAWIDTLRAARVVPTLTLVPLRNGDRIGTIEVSGAPRHVVAFEFLDGREPEAGEDRIRWFGTLGALTARLHAHARGWPRPPGFVRKVWDFDAMLGRVALWGDWRAGPGLDAPGRAVLERAAARISARLSDYGRGPDRFGLVHADLRLANLLVDDSTLQLIDFDDCGFSWFLYDFAAAISFIEHEADVPALLASWLEGYERVTPLAAEHRDMIPVFIMLRRMLLTAWIASHAETPTAQALGPAYTEGTVRLATSFLSQG